MKKILAILLTLVTAFTLVACGGGTGSGTQSTSERQTSSEKQSESGSGSKKTLDIMTINKGYGTLWLDALIDGFKAKNPDVTITVKKETEDTTMSGLLEAGSKYSKYDLYFTGFDAVKYIEKGIANEEDALLADITDIYEGENGLATIMDESLLKAYRHENKDGDDVYYTMPWTQSFSGLIVNGDVMSSAFGNDWRSTVNLRTTDELLSVAESLKTKGKKAFIHCSDTNFYHFLYEVWWAQYEGLAGTDRFFSGQYEDEMGALKFGPQIFLQEGRLKALQVLEEIVKPSNGYDIAESNGYDWNQTQMYFMLGQSAFFPNGDWNNLEMAKSFPDANTYFVRMPVISALGAKLGITESELKSVVSYVDKVLDGETGMQIPELHPAQVEGKTYTSEEIIERVTEARTISYSYANYFTAFIASYSDVIDVAKDFLKYMISEEGQIAYSKATGLSLPFGYDISQNSEVWNSMSDFSKSRWNALAKNPRYYYTRTDLPLGQAGLKVYKSIAEGPLEVLLSKDYNRKTAQQIYEEDYAYYTMGSAWSDLLRLANIV